MLRLCSGFLHLPEKVLFIVYGGFINGIEWLYKSVFSCLLKLSEVDVACG